MHGSHILLYSVIDVNYKRKEWLKPWDVPPRSEEAGFPRAEAKKLYDNADDASGAIAVDLITPGADKIGGC